jgi:hypothetical protein
MEPAHSDLQLGFASLDEKQAVGTMFANGADGTAE